MIFFLFVTWFSLVAIDAKAATTEVHCGHATRGIAISFAIGDANQSVITLSQYFSSGGNQLEAFARSLDLIEEGPWEGKLVATIPTGKCFFSSTTDLVLATCSASGMPMALMAQSLDGTPIREITIDMFDANALNVKRTMASSQGNHVRNEEEVHMRIRSTDRPTHNAILEFTPASRCQNR